MKRKAIGGGAYVSEDGRYWERPRGKTWRLLRHVSTQREAIRIASARDPKTIGSKFESLAQIYREAGCPDARLQPRGEEFCKAEKANIAKLTTFFNGRPSDKISVSDIPPYRAWRVTQQKQGQSGNRAVDKETQTLSNIYRYAVVAGLFPHNPVKSGRPRYQTADKVSHSKERAPKSSDACHQICGDLLCQVETETAGWFGLFAMFTGCRSAELIRLRVDAKDESEPGFISWRKEAPKTEAQPLGLLHIRRAKGGINPECIIGLEFAQMLQVFDLWHRSRFPDSPWYFPNAQGEQVHRRVIYQQITRIATSLGHRVTPHGFRSFYVTKRRSDGVSDTVIAGEIGDKTVALMQTTYGERPRNWLGGNDLKWLPDKGKTAWEIWLERNSGLTTVVKMKGGTQESKAKSSMFSMPPVWRNGRRTGLKILGP